MRPAGIICQIYVNRRYAKLTLLTRWSISGDGWGVTNVLVVTTTVRVIYWVHSNTTSTWPAVSLDSVLVVGSTSLEEWLVDTTTTCYDTNSSSWRANDGLLGTWRKTDSSLTVNFWVTDDSSVVSWASCQCTSVTGLFFDVTDDGTFWHLWNWQNVTDGESSLLTTVDECTGVETFGSDEGFSTELVAVLITENDTCKWSTTVSVSLDKILKREDFLLTDQRRGWSPWLYHGRNRYAQRSRKYGAELGPCCGGCVSGKYLGGWDLVLESWEKNLPPFLRCERMTLPLKYSR